ncbi:copper transporter [Nocardia lasii]|uniref:Copper transporter n=1 Tax=Nocardia lasii TaxID=1616107 RepID=A0ABW1JQJ0_9NOCA
MISLRQHAISIAAIFLALAVGVVLGSHTLAGDMLAGLRSDRADLNTQVDTLTTQNAQLAARLDAADQFIADAAPRILAGTLADRSVVLVTTPDADPADIDGVSGSLLTAGATVTGRIALTESFVDSGEGDRMRATLTNIVPAGAQLDTGAVDQGSLAGDLLGLALLQDPATNRPRSTPQELALILETLRGGGFLTYTDTPTTPAQLAVVITGNGVDSTPDQSATIARFTAALRARAAGTVLAGPPAAAEGTAPIATVRAAAPLATTITTVDNVNRETGRVTTTLALTEQLTGGAGRYGTAPTATALTLASVPK